jgi:hypothetical protein
MPYRAAAEAALESWRQAARIMATSPVGGPDWQQAFIDAEAAKGVYQLAIDDARRGHKRVPPPFHEARGGVRLENRGT